MGRRELEINFENAREEELRVAMDAAPNKRSYIRLAAMRAMYLGMDRESICRIYDRSDRMVRLWITLFNEGGIDALATKPRRGRTRKVKLQKLNDLLVPVLENPAQAQELHWTGVKLHGWLQQAVGIELSYSTTIRYLHELGYNLRVPRRWAQGQDEEQRAQFVKDIKVLEEDSKVELWFADECGVEGDPRPRRRWSHRSSHPKLPYLGKHIRSNVIGAVCPQSGETFAMIFDGVDTNVFQCWMDQLAEAIPACNDKRRILIVDNASWHKAKSLHWHHFEPMFLPPYSPDLNPIERLWLRLKMDFFSNFIAKTPLQLIDHLRLALSHFIDNKNIVASQCAFRK